MTKYSVWFEALNSNLQTAQMTNYINFKLFNTKPPKKFRDKNANQNVVNKHNYSTNIIVNENVVNKEMIEWTRV